jgi:hypothetical protein
LGDTLIALTNLHQVKVHNADAKVIVDALSEFFDTPTVELWFKCNAITCNVPPPKDDTIKTVEKKQCSELEMKSVKVTLPKESGTFTLSFTLDAASGVIALITGGISGATIAAKVDVNYTVALVEYKRIAPPRTRCSPPNCEQESGEIAALLHCTIALSAEVDATIDLGFGTKISVSSVTGKNIITASWDGNPVVDVPYHC